MFNSLSFDNVVVPITLRKVLYLRFDQMGFFSRDRNLRAGLTRLWCGSKFNGVNLR